MHCLGLQSAWPPHPSQLRCYMHPHRTDPTPHTHTHLHHPDTENLFVEGYTLVTCHHILLDACHSTTCISSLGVSHPTRCIWIIKWPVGVRDRPKDPFYYQLSMPNNFHNRSLCTSDFNYNRLQSSSVSLQTHVFETPDRPEHLIFGRSYYPVRYKRH